MATGILFLQKSLARLLAQKDSSMEELTSTFANDQRFVIGKGSVKYDLSFQVKDSTSSFRIRPLFLEVRCLKSYRFGIDS